MALGQPGGGTNEADVFQIRGSAHAEGNGFGHHIGEGNVDNDNVWPSFASDHPRLEGRVGQGELVPSVRELARELCINPNTVARAYRELQSDGVLETVRGTGLAVAPGADKQCRTDRVKLIRQSLRQVLVEAWQSRLEAGQLRSLVESELAKVEQREV